MPFFVIASPDLLGVAIPLYQIMHIEIASLRSPVYRQAGNDDIQQLVNNPPRLQTLDVGPWTSDFSIILTGLQVPESVYRELQKPRLESDALRARLLILRDRLLQP